VAAGQFLIEYIGEVLEEEEYIRRKQYYIGTGQRHYYFMNIGNGEVIDACRKVGSSSNTQHTVLFRGSRHRIMGSR
jgi:histone-lysine N-methyltransferase SETD2